MRNSGEQSQQTVKPILTITGSDSAGGSGIQADIRTISCLGGSVASVITSITVQNTLGIQEFYDLPAPIIHQQIDAIVNDIAPSIVKIGLIHTKEALQVILQALLRYQPDFVLYDPIIRSSNGEPLMSDDLLSQIRQQLLPLCHLILVNRAEEVQILGTTFRPSSFHPQKIWYLADRRIHGRTNELASATAYYLSVGLPTEEAMEKARQYVELQITDDGNLHSRSSELFKSFLEAVEGHYQENSDVNFYADYLNVSSRYLSQVTHRINGKSPKAIIDNRLLQTLQKELRTTLKPIQEIAYENGFSSQAHFTKFFKRQTGMTPTMFRRNKGE